MALYAFCENKCKHEIDIETITNENGTAIKYPDGTMICMKRLDIGGSVSSPTVAITNGSSPAYYSDDIEVGAFPVPFTELHYNTSKFVAAQGAYNIWQGNSPNGGAMGKFPPVRLMCSNSYNTYGVCIFGLAIGRWK